MTPPAAVWGRVSPSVAPDTSAQWCSRPTGSHRQHSFPPFNPTEEPSPRWRAPEAGARPVRIHSAGAMALSPALASRSIPPLAILITTSTDLAVPGAGLPLSLSITYDAVVAQSEIAGGQPAGPLGYGWSDNLGMSLSTTPAPRWPPSLRRTAAETTFNQYVVGRPRLVTSATNFCAAAPRTTRRSTTTLTAPGPIPARYSGATRPSPSTPRGALTQVGDAWWMQPPKPRPTQPGPARTACPSGDTCTVWTRRLRAASWSLAVDFPVGSWSRSSTPIMLAATFSYSGLGLQARGRGPDAGHRVAPVHPGGITATYTYDSGNASADFDYDMLSETPPERWSNGQRRQHQRPDRPADDAGRGGHHLRLRRHQRLRVGGTTTITAYPTAQVRANPKMSLWTPMCPTPWSGRPPAMAPPTW